MLFVIGAAFILCRRLFDQKRWLLMILLVTCRRLDSDMNGVDRGRIRPATMEIGEVLPTFMSTSTPDGWQTLSAVDSLIVLYTVFLIAEMYLMIKFVRRGPSSLYTGRYHFELKACNGLTVVLKVRS